MKPELWPSKTKNQTIQNFTIAKKSHGIVLRVNEGFLSLCSCDCSNAVLKKVPQQLPGVDNDVDDLTSPKIKCLKFAPFLQTNALSTYRSCD